MDKLFWIFIDALGMACGAYYAIKGNYAAATYFLLLALYASREVENSNVDAT